MNHLVTIPKSDISKADIADIAAGLILRIEEGEVNPIAAHVRLKAVVKALEQVLKATEDIVRDEAEKHGKTFSAFGAEEKPAGIFADVRYRDDCQRAILIDGIGRASALAGVGTKHI